LINKKEEKRTLPGLLSEMINKVNRDVV